MPISPVATETAQTNGARTRLSDNYDTFLILLTAQLQNQDPLAPMDSTQFTQQLVQFSQVEQQIRTNEQLEGLVTQYQAASAGAALSYLGRDAIIEANDTYLAGGAANWAYRLPRTAEDVTIRVRDLDGRTIFTSTGPATQGEHLFTWDGDDRRGRHGAGRGLCALDRGGRQHRRGAAPHHHSSRNHYGRRFLGLLATGHHPKRHAGARSHPLSTRQQLGTAPAKPGAATRRSAPSSETSIPPRGTQMELSNVHLYRPARGRFRPYRQFERARRHFRQYRQRQHRRLQARRASISARWSTRRTRTRPTMPAACCR